MKTQVETVRDPSMSRKPVTLHRLRQMHASGEKIAMLTCYDAAFASLLDAAGVDVLLVGDSLGMVLQGHSDTLAVSVDELVYHTRCVARGNHTAWVIADMPFGSYQESAETAMRQAVRLMQAGANMVKIEGGGWTEPTVRFLVDRGVPVCGHLGLTPQSVHMLGGYRIQGRDDRSVASLHEHAERLAAAGAELLVLELVPAAVGRELTNLLSVPVIGIGAGVHCSGQVLVLHDMLGVVSKPPPRFVQDFLRDGGSVEAAVKKFVHDVKQGLFPSDMHSY